MTDRPSRLATARADGTVYVAGGALTAAVGAYIFQLTGGRALGSDEFAPITVLWTLQFLAFTIVLIPIEHLTVRRLAMASDHPLRHDLKLIVPVVGGTALTVCVAMLLARDQLLNGEIVHAVQAGLIVLGYGGFAFARGVLGGRREFRPYGLASAGESLSRLAWAALLLAFTRSSVGLAWALVAAPWIIHLMRPFARRGEQSAPPEARAGRFLAAFILGNAASHTILASGPLVVAALGGGSQAISTFFVTLILARAPLTFSYGLLSRLLEPMARMASDHRNDSLVKWSRRIVGAAILLLVPAWIVGRFAVPNVVALLFGNDFRPSAQLGGIIATGVVAAMASVVTGQILVARGQTARLALAWLAGLAAAIVGVVAASGTPEVRTGIGFLAGEITALAGVALLTARPGPDHRRAVDVLGVGPAEGVL